MLVLNRVFSVALLTAMSFCSQAMSINSLMLVNEDAAEGQNGIFKITNHEDITYFLKTEVFKVDVVDNQVVKTKYTKDNLSEWDIVPKPSKLVVEPKIVKEFMVEEVCGDRCNSDRDRVYQINIIPVSYELSNEKQSRVNMLFGFAPYYVIPATESHVKYDLEYDGKHLRANNSGNTLIRLVIDQCSTKSEQELKDINADNTKRCRISYTVIAGRDRSFELPEELRTRNLDVTVLNYNESFHEEKTLRVQP